MSAHSCLDEGLDFTIVVEPSQYKEYRKHFSKNNIYQLRKDNKGIAYKRNQIIKMAKSDGYDAHWQIDDKIKSFYHKGKDSKVYRIPMLDSIAALEKIYDSYTDVAVIGQQLNLFTRSLKSPLMFNYPFSCWLQRTREMPRFNSDTMDDWDYYMQLLHRNENVVRSNFYLRGIFQVGGTPGGNSVASEKQLAALNSKARKVVSDYPDILKICEGQRKDGVLQPRPKVRISSYFKQRPTLVSGISEEKEYRILHGFRP